MIWAIHLTDNKTFFAFEKFWKKNQNFSKAKKFYYQSNKSLKIMFCLMSAVALIGVKIWLVHLKALEMRMRKLVLDLSLAQILPEKINKVFLPKKLGFINVLRTVGSTIFAKNRLELSYDSKRPILCSPSFILNLI